MSSGEKYVIYFHPIAGGASIRDGASIRINTVLVALISGIAEICQLKCKSMLWVSDQLQVIRNTLLIHVYINLWKILS